MDCERCHERPANVHITQFINGNKQEIHLCEKCAQEMKVELEMPKLPIHNINNLLGFVSKIYENDRRIENLKCPTCQNSYQKIAETGYVGCSECYQHFAKQLEPIMLKIHGSNQHRGKIPKRMGNTYRLRREIEELKQSLKKAVEHEEYEEAAQLRDKIKLLENSLA